MMPHFSDDDIGQNSCLIFR